MNNKEEIWYFIKSLSYILSYKKSAAHCKLYTGNLCQEVMSDGLNFDIKRIQRKYIRRDIHFNIIFCTKKLEQIVSYVHQKRCG